jgi:hypothetical protein
VRGERPRATFSDFSDVRLTLFESPLKFPWRIFRVFSRISRAVGIQLELRPNH